MDKISTFIVSQQDQLAEADALREWEMAMDLNAISEKVCVSINLYNGVPVVPMALITKESRGLLSKLMSQAQDKVYSLHRLIVVAYVPAVLRTTTGTLAIKLFNTSTAETIDIVAEHPVNIAATFVARWPRAVLAKADGISLLVAASNVPTKTGSLIGSFHPFWEDKLSRKMVYEKQLPTLVYRLEEQEPTHYVKDLSMLRALMASRVHLGGKGSDLVPQTISLKPLPSEKHKIEGDASQVPSREPPGAAVQSAPVWTARHKQPNKV